MSRSISARRRFPWELLVAILGLAVAALCVRVFLTDPFDHVILIIDGYRSDGPAHSISLLATALAVASLFGGAGLVALRAFFRRTSEPNRVDTRVFGDHP